MKVTQSCLTLCNPKDFTVHVILQARILEWVAFPFSRGSSQPRNQTGVCCIAGRFFTNWSIRDAQYSLFNPKSILNIVPALDLIYFSPIYNVWYQFLLPSSQKNSSCHSPLDFQFELMPRICNFFSLLIKWISGSTNLRIKCLQILQSYLTCGLRLPDLHVWFLLCMLVNCPRV